MKRLILRLTAPYQIEKSFQEFINKGIFYCLLLPGLLLSNLQAIGQSHIISATYGSAYVKKHPIAGGSGNYINLTRPGSSSGFGPSTNLEYLFINWYGAGDVYRYNLDGTNGSLWFDYNFGSWSDTYITGSCINSSHLFVGNEYSNTVVKINLNNPGDYLVINFNGVTGVSDNTTCFLAITSNYLFCGGGSNGNSTHISRCNLDGTGKLKLLNANSAIMGLAADENYIYWRTYNGQVGRANHDGSNANHNWITGLSSGHTWGLLVNSSSVYVMYDYNFLYRYNIDGTNQTNLGSGYLNRGLCFATYLTNCSWTGTNNSDWNTPANWSIGSVPNSTHNVTIPDVTNDPVINSDASVNNLTINSSAAITLSPVANLSVTGTLTNNAGTDGIIIQSTSAGTASLIHNTADVNATIERYITGSTTLNAMTYHLVSVPLTPATVSNSSLFAGTYLYNFDVAGDSWNGLGTGLDNPLDETVGYMIFSPEAAHTFTFTGPMNAGTFTPSVTNAGNGYNLVPNPYPSAIDWLSAGWTKTNVNNAVYIWPSGGSNYAAFVNGTPTNGGSQYIPAGQAFFVKTSGAPTFSMTNTVRVHNDQAFFKSDEDFPNLLRIRATANDLTDEAVVRFSEKATSNSDGDYDAWKMFGSEGAPQIYTLAADAEKLAINCLPYDEENYIVPLNFELSDSGEASLLFSNIQSFDPIINIRLEDIKTNQVVNLRQSQEYRFNYEAGDISGRFKLLFADNIGINDPVTGNHRIWVYDNTLYLEVPELAGENALIEVFNTTGQLIFNKQITLNDLSTLRLNATGPVVVNVTTNSKRLVTKSIILP